MDSLRKEATPDRRTIDKLCVRSCNYNNQQDIPLIEDCISWFTGMLLISGSTGSASFRPIAVEPRRANQLHGWLNRILNYCQKYQRIKNKRKEIHNSFR
jgi:hypothetical protein